MHYVLPDASTALRIFRCFFFRSQAQTMIFGLTYDDTIMQTERVCLKIQCKKKSKAPVQTSKSACVTVGGHTTQSLHNTWPESFSD